MNVSLNRIILYVADVRRLSDFYRDAFGLPVIEQIEGEWSVLRAGRCELALHRAGAAFRAPDARSHRAHSNVKVVLAVDGDLETLRAKLLESNIQLGEIKSYPGFTGLLCDGTDPEGNVFQLSQA